jgi:hypothetical protein
MAKTDLMALGIAADRVTNHFGTHPEKDYFQSPNRDVPHWNETGFFSAYNPDQNVGVFTHVGRCQQDLDLFWSHSLIFLPDGEILADRSYGRSPNGRDVGAGSSRIIIDEPFKQWTSIFDGHGERTSTKGLSEAVRGHGPGIAVRYEVTGIALDPVWDLVADNKNAPPAGDWAGDGHYQQNFRTTGTLNVAGKTYSLDGIGWNDHSRGPRTFATYGTHRWISAILPGATVHAITMWDTEGNIKTATGSLFRDGHHENVSVNFPPIGDLVGGPLEYDIILTHTSGEVTKLRAKTLNAQMLTITSDAENLNGIYWDGDDGATVHYDSMVQLTMADGRTGYGYAERGARLSDLRALRNG